MSQIVDDINPANRAVCGRERRRARSAGAGRRRGSVRRGTVRVGRLRVEGFPPDTAGSARYGALSGGRAPAGGRGPGRDGQPFRKPRAGRDRSAARNVLPGLRPDALRPARQEPARRAPLCRNPGRRRRAWKCTSSPPSRWKCATTSRACPARSTCSRGARWPSRGFIGQVALDEGGRVTFRDVRYEIESGTILTFAKRAGAGADHRSAGARRRQGVRPGGQPVGGTWPRLETSSLSSYLPRPMKPISSTSC